MRSTLGIVDNSFKPYKYSGKMQESLATLCEFFIASENPSIPLDSVDEAFDDVALFVAVEVIAPRLLAIAARRDDHLDLSGCERLSQRVGTVALIGNDSVKMERCEQRFSLEKVMAFTASQDEL